MKEKIKQLKINVRDLELKQIDLNILLANEGQDNERVQRENEELESDQDRVTEERDDAYDSEEDMGEALHYEQVAHRQLQLEQIGGVPLDRVSFEDRMRIAMPGREELDE